MSEKQWNPKYRARIVGAELGESETTKSPQIEIGFQFLYVYGDDGSATPTSGNCRVYLPLSDKTIGSTQEPGWVIQQLIELGFRGPSFSNLDGLVGREADVSWKDDVYKDKPTKKWGILRSFSGAKNPASKQTISALDAKFAGLLNKAKNTPALPPPVASPAPKPAAPNAAPRTPVSPPSNAFQGGPDPAGDPPGSGYGGGNNDDDSIPF